MAGWLKRTRDEGDEEGIHPGEDALARVPASARGPEANRFTPLGSDMPDDSEGDQDIDLIQSLISEVEQEEAKKNPPASLRMRENSPNARKSTTEDLEMFRASKTQGDIALRHDFRVEHVEMADLLEDLSVTAAALRGRKAA
jgi:hypothetical protein